MQPDKNDTSWVAPLVGRLLEAPVVQETHGPMTCPICDCDHQVFQGTGVLGLDKEGKHLVCAFPSTETMVKIDLPQGMKIGGLMSYTRFVCGCNGHSWAFIQAFLKDSTMSWCCDLNPPAPAKKMCGKKGKQVPAHQPEAPTLIQTLQNMIKGMLAAGHKPALMLGPGVLAQLSPEEISSLQAQGVVINPQIQVPNKMPPMTAAAFPKPNLKPGPIDDDHEHPLNRLPATVRYAWQNWKDEKPLPDDEIFNFSLPKVPVKSTDLSGPPHLAVGTTDAKLLNPLQEWVFALSVEIAADVRHTIHAFIYWENMLLVVTNAPPAQRKGIAEGVANGVIGLKKFKPDLYMLTKKDYSVLVRSKADQAKKPKK